MVRGYLYFFVLVIGIVSFFSIVSGQVQCTESTDSECGAPITTPGQGAVQLCEDCFVCGILDGVCPEDFASNETETVFERRVVQMRTDTTPFTSYDAPVIYPTGDDACAVIGGACDEVQQNNNGDWEEAPGISCSTNIGNNGFELRAVCTNVPKTAGCYNCPDPDCLTEVRGLLYNSEDPDEGIDDGLIIFKPVNPNSPARFEERTDNLGMYSFNEAPRGRFTYECLKVNYEPYYGEALLIRGQNIIDCPMRPAACEDDPVCSMFDVDDQPVCRAICEGEAGCIFNQTIEVERHGQSNITVNASTLCDGRRADSQITVTRHNETHVTAIRCCTGIPTFIPRPQLQIGGNVTDLVTRDFVRILDDEQVNVKIIVYKTD